MIWFLIGATLLAVLVYFIVPTKDNKILDNKQAALSHFREQLAALDRDKQQGKISEDAYLMNKTEISRHLLRENDNSGQSLSRQTFSQSSILLMITVIVGGSLAAYITLGQPTLPSPTKTDSESSLNQPISSDSDITFADALQQMQNDRQKKSDDPKFLALYARTHFQLGKYQQAAQAYNLLTNLQADNPRWPILHAESLMAIAEGQVPPAAMMILEKYQYRYPDHPMGHYLVGLYHQQKGDQNQALAVWEAFAKKSAPDAPWMRSFMPKIRAIKHPIPNIDPAAMQRITALPQNQKQELLLTLIRRLAAQLENVSDYPEAYLRLAQLYLMTGQQQPAIKALKAGIKGSSDPAQAIPLSQMLDKIKELSDTMN